MSHSLRRKELAAVSEFFSFHLTQGTFSYSRKDVEQKFMPKYVGLKIIPANSFEILDRKFIQEINLSIL